MHIQRLTLLLLLNVVLIPAWADPPSVPGRDRVVERNVDKQQPKLPTPLHLEPLHLEPLHLELRPDKVIWDGDEPVTATAVFTNQTQQSIELLYGGLGNPVGICRHAASVRSISGNRIIKCESKSATAQLSCEARLIKIGEIPGEDENTEIEIVERLIEETEEVPKQFKLGPGRSARFPVRLDNYLDHMVLPDGSTARFSTARLPGRYEFKLHYKLTGNLLWQGEVTSQPVEFEVSASRPAARDDE